MGLPTVYISSLCNEASESQRGMCSECRASRKSYARKACPSSVGLAFPYTHFCNVLTSDTRNQTAHSNPFLWLISHQTRTLLWCCVVSIPRSTTPNSQRLPSTFIRTPHASSSSSMRTARSLSAPLRFALNRDPLSIGKPARTMLDCIQAKYVPLSRCHRD